jgi:hypothetical protein
MTTYTNVQELNKGVVGTSFAVTNYTSDYALDCNAEAGCTALADVVASIIRELINQGILKGTVAT